MNEDNAADALLKLPRSGEEHLLAEACKVIGFEVRGGGVYHDEHQLASIQDQRLVIVNEEAVKKLSYELPPLNRQRKNKLNEIYFQLNADRVAIHEAGHGVAALLKQVDFCYIRVGTEHEIQLCPMWNRTADDFSGKPWIVRNKQFMLAAGAAAEKLVLGEYDKRGVVADRKELNCLEIMLRDAKGDDPPDDLDVFDECVNRVADQLSAEKVRAVAKHLSERKFLSRTEVKRIVEEIESA